MQLSLTFLGTSAAAPTSKRALSSALLAFEGAHLLFDCGEGTQRRIMQAGLSYQKISHIFLSHFHGDHVLGLPGLLSTMHLYERDTPLYVHGPRGVKAKVQAALELAELTPGYEIFCKQAKQGVIVKEKKFSVNAVEARHTTRCYAYVFEENSKAGTFMRKKAEEELGLPPGPLYKQLAAGKTVTYKGKKIKPEDVMDYSKGRSGRKVGVLLDTRPLAKARRRPLQGADLLVHDASFSQEQIARAKETGHSTSLEAAQLASDVKAKQLYLTHFSTRYTDTNPLVQEARTVFKNTQVAKDLLTIKVPRP